MDRKTTWRVVFAASMALAILALAFVAIVLFSPKPENQDQPKAAPTAPVAPTANQPTQAENEQAPSPGRGVPPSAQRSAPDDGIDPWNTAQPKPWYRTYGYGTSDTQGKVEIAELPSGCKVTRESYLPGCGRHGADLPINCGQNGDFCLSVMLSRDRGAAKQAAMDVLLTSGYDRYKQYVRWGRVTVQTAPITCSRRDRTCSYETAELCPWMTPRTTDCKCAGGTVTRILTTPADPKLEGHTYVAVLTGLWNLSRYEEGLKIFDQILESAKWTVYEYED